MLLEHVGEPKGYQLMKLHVNKSVCIHKSYLIAIDICKLTLKHHEVWEQFNIVMLSIRVDERKEQLYDLPVLFDQLTSGNQ